MKYLKTLLLLLSVASVTLMVQSCELLDPCVDTICANGGECLDGTCDCPVGFSGDLCENHCSADIIGTWNVTNATSFCATESFTFIQGATVSEVKMSQTWGNGVGTQETVGTLSEDCGTFTYAWELEAGNTGTITFNGNTLTCEFKGAGGDCSFEATKQ